MQLIIPAGGLGTRMRPHTWSKPKPLIPVAGKPSIAHIIDSFAETQVDKIVLITGRNGDQLLDYVRANYPYPAEAVEQKVMRGQSDALAIAESLVDMDGAMFMIFSDTLFETDLRVLATLDADGAAFTKEVPDPSRFGIAVSGADGLISKLVEKPAEPESHDAVVGMYYFKKARTLYDAIHAQIERNITLKNEFFLADAIQIAIDNGAKIKKIAIDVWEDTGTVDAILHSNRYLLRRFQSAQSEPYMEGTSVIVPPVYLGANVVLEQSVVGPYVSLGDGAQISNSIVRDSIIGEKVQLQNVSLSGSLLGDRVKLSEGFRQLNLGDDSSIAFDTTGEIDDTFK